MAVQDAEGLEGKAANSWKQWKVVAELIPEEHQSTIETEGNAETRYAYGARQVPDTPDREAEARRHG